MWHIKVGDELPKLGDILNAESRYDRSSYRVKVIKIKKLEWAYRWKFLWFKFGKYLVIYLMVRSVGECEKATCCT